jgi:hypothetical protein
MEPTAKETTLRQRAILAAAIALIHLASPARTLGDYLIYRTGIAGKLPRIALLERLRVAWPAQLLGSVLFLLAIWVSAAYCLRGWHVGLPAAIVLAGALTLVGFHWLQHFQRTWVCVDTYQVGTARVLAGRCAVFQVFLGQDWRQEDRRRCRRAVRAACDWLEAQAQAHGVSLHLMTDPKALSLPDALKIGAAAFGHPDRWRAYRYEADGARQRLDRLRPQLASAITERARRMTPPPDHICVIAHLPVRKIGFALPARNDLHLESDLEICACGRKSSAAVYAHELLHLFGALDLYLNPWRVLTREGEADPRARLFEQQLVVSGLKRFHAYFGDSIMGSISPGLHRLRVDPLTARAVGWRKPDKPFMRTVRRLEQAIVETVVDVVERT